MDDVSKVVLATKLPKENKEWVGLTEEEKMHIYAKHSYMSVIGFVDFVQAKLKEKNSTIEKNIQTSDNNG